MWGCLKFESQLIDEIYDGVTIPASQNAKPFAESEREARASGPGANERGEEWARRRRSRLRDHRQTVRAVCALKTKRAQKGIVAPNAWSIAQAYFEPAARFRAVHAGETLVGFVMWRPADRDDTCFPWRFMSPAPTSARATVAPHWPWCSMSFGERAIDGCGRAMSPGKATHATSTWPSAFVKPGRPSGERVIDLML